MRYTTFPKAETPEKPPAPPPPPPPPPKPKPSTPWDERSSFGPSSPQVKAAPGAPAATSLLTEDAHDGRVNCLDLAADWVEKSTPALRARSEFVFLKDLRPGAEGQSGHVVVRQGERIVDPTSGKSYESLQAFLKEKPQYQSAGTLPATSAARIFSTAPGSPARQKAIADAKVPASLQRMMVADVSSAQAKPPATKPAAPPATKPAAPATTKPAAPPATKPAGPARPEYTQAQADKDASALHDAMKGGLTGWGTDKDKLLKTLEGKRPEQLDMIRESYQDHYGANLDADVRDELSGPDLKRAQALLRSDAALDDAVAIQAELDGIFGSGEDLLKVLEKRTPDERRAIAWKFTELNGGLKPPQSPEGFMLSRLEKELDKAQLARARSLLGAGSARTPGESNALEVQAIKDGITEDLSGWNDEDRLFARLEQATPEQRQLLAKDTGLQRKLKDELGKEDYERALGLLQGNSAQVDAARLASAMGGFLGADEEAVRAVLEGKKPGQLDAIKAEYQRQTGRSLEAEIRGWDRADRDVTLRLLHPSQTGDALGQASADAEKLHLAMDGLGTDVDAIRAVLQGRSKTDIDRIAAAYEQKYERNLRGALDSELDGRDQMELIHQDFDLGAIDPNAPGAAQERVRRLRELQQFESGLGVSLLDGLQRVTKGESDNDVLTRNLNRADRALQTGDLQRAQSLTGYATDDLQALQAGKDSLADTAASVAVVATTTVAVVATGGAATPLALAGYATLGAATRTVTYGALQGDAAGTEDLSRQALIGAVEGGTAVLPVGKASTATAAVGKGTATTALRETAGTTLRSVTLQGVKEGAVGGAAGGAVDAATRRETWGDGFLPGLGTVATRAVLDGTVGAATGGVFSAGAAKGMEALAPREIPVLRNPDLPGNTTHVRYDNGRVRIEAGPLATASDIQAHLETARILQRYEGPLGKIRQLQDRVSQALTSTPGHGTQGFESRLEVQKLQGILGELQAARQRIDDSIGAVSGKGSPATVAEREVLQREIADVESQLRSHAAQVDSLAPGRGYVALEGQGPRVEARPGDIGDRLDTLAAQLTRAGGGDVAQGGSFKITTPGAQLSGGRVSQAKSVELVFSPEDLYVRSFLVGDTEVKLRLDGERYPSRPLSVLDEHEVDAVIRSFNKYVEDNAGRGPLAISLTNPPRTLERLPDLVAMVAEGTRFPDIRNHIQSLQAGRGGVDAVWERAIEDLDALPADVRRQYDPERVIPGHYVKGWEDRYAEGNASFRMPKWPARR